LVFWSKLLLFSLYLPLLSTTRLLAELVALVALPQNPLERRFFLVLRVLVKLSPVLAVYVLLLQADSLVNALTTSQVEIGAFGVRLGTFVKLSLLPLPLLISSLLMLA
jgi:hypothetical protein